MFESWLSLFSAFPDFSIPSLYDFSDKVLKDKEKLKTVQELMLIRLTKAAIQAASGQTYHFVGDEEQITKKITSLIPVLKLMDIIDEIRSDFSDIYLDQKQVFVNACLKLQRGAK